MMPFLRMSILRKGSKIKLTHPGYYSLLYPYCRLHITGPRFPARCRGPLCRKTLQLVFIVPRMRFTQGLQRSFYKPRGFDYICKMLRKDGWRSLPRCTLLAPLKRFSKLCCGLQQLAQLRVSESNVNQPRIVVGVEKTIYVHSPPEVLPA